MIDAGGMVNGDGAGLLDGSSGLCVVGWTVSLCTPHLRLHLIGGLLLQRSLVGNRVVLWFRLYDTALGIRYL
jgi:hypothetical protein